MGLSFSTNPDWSFWQNKWYASKDELD